MIDFHSHVLPAVDDGAKDCEQSYQMLTALKADGVSTVLCTPHFYWSSSGVERFLQKRAEAFAKLQDMGVSLVLAAEVAFSELKINYESLIPLAIGNTRYILLELPWAKKWDAVLMDNIESFIRETNLIPVIAHIERYEPVQKKPALIAELLKMGCLLQVNAESVISAKPHSLAAVLLTYGQVHALGSDCHDAQTRPPRYGEAIGAIRARYGEECVAHLQTCMQKILANEKVRVPYIHRVQKFLGRYS